MCYAYTFNIVKLDITYNNIYFFNILYYNVFFRQLILQNENEMKKIGHIKLYRVKCFHSDYSLSE